MLIDMSNFGDMLMSRSSGREDFMKASAYILDECKDNKLELDFKNIKVLTPSWADEFITGLAKKNYELKYINTENPAVKASLEMVLNPVDVKKFAKSN